jgi:hypothetical protein
MRLLGAESEAAHLFEDLVGGFSPREGLPLLIVCVDVGADRGP